MLSSLSLLICVDDVLYFLFAVVRKEVADVQALAVRLALDECPNFNSSSSDIAVIIESYRFLYDSLSVFCVDRHISSPFRFRKAKYKRPRPQILLESAGCQRNECQIA